MAFGTGGLQRHIFRHRLHRVRIMAGLTFQALLMMGGSQANHILDDRCTCHQVTRIAVMAVQAQALGGINRQQMLVNFIFVVHRMAARAIQGIRRHIRF